MNKDKIIGLLLDGAYWNQAEEKFYHPSFRKGYRAMRWSNISMYAAKKALGDKLAYNNETTIFKLA